MQPLKDYINERDYKLSGDEILRVLDDRIYPEINHFEKVNGVYKMWSEDGEYFEFTKRRVELNEFDNQIDDYINSRIIEDDEEFCNYEKEHNDDYVRESDSQRRYNSYLEYYK